MSLEAYPHMGDRPAHEVALPGDARMLLTGNHAVSYGAMLAAAKTDWPANGCVRRARRSLSVGWGPRDVA